MRVRVVYDAYPAVVQRVAEVGQAPAGGVGLARRAWKVQRGQRQQQRRRARAPRTHHHQARQARRLQVATTRACIHHNDKI